MAKSVRTFKIKKYKHPSLERLFYEKTAELFRGPNSAIAKFARTRNMYEALKDYAKNREQNRYYPVDDSVLEYFHDHFLIYCLKGEYIPEAFSKADRVRNASSKTFDAAFYDLRCAVCDNIYPISGCYKRCIGLIKEIISIDEQRGLKTVTNNQENIDKMLYTFTLCTATKNGKTIPVYDMMRRYVSSRFWLMENRDKSLLELCTEAWKEIYRQIPKTS